MTIFFQPRYVAAVISELPNSDTIWQDLKALPKDLPGWPQGLANRLHRDGVLRPVGRIKDHRNGRMIWGRGTNYGKLMRWA